jgi:hypothetical protein
MATLTIVLLALAIQLLHQRPCGTCRQVRGQSWGDGAGTGCRHPGPAEAAPLRLPPGRPDGGAVEPAPRLPRPPALRLATTGSMATLARAFNHSGPSWRTCLISLRTRERRFTVALRRSALRPN